MANLIPLYEQFALGTTNLVALASWFCCDGKYQLVDSQMIAA